MNTYLKLCSITQRIQKQKQKQSRTFKKHDLVTPDNIVNYAINVIQVTPALFSATLLLLAMYLMPYGMQSSVLFFISQVLLNARQNEVISVMVSVVTEVLTFQSHFVKSWANTKFPARQEVQTYINRMELFCFYFSPFPFLLLV